MFLNSITYFVIDKNHYYGFEKTFYINTTNIINNTIEIFVIILKEDCINLVTKMTNLITNVLYSILLEYIYLIETDYDLIFFKNFQIMYPLLCCLAHLCFKRSSL